MRETLETSGPKSLINTRSATFSQASEAGVTHSGWLDGRPIPRSGPAPAPVSPSVKLDIGEQLMIPGISGLLSAGSSPSADLQRSLESRLRASLEGLGSPEYALTWKHWDMESGEPICALRGSVRRTSGKGCGGWPTPTTRDHKDGTKKSCQNVPVNALLGRAVHLAGWQTPTAQNAKHATLSPSEKDRLSRGIAGLHTQAFLAGWPTPTSSMMTWQDLEQALTAGNSSQRKRYEESTGLLLAGWPTPRASENVQTNLKEIAEKGSSWLGQGRGATVSTMAMLVHGRDSSGGPVKMASTEKSRLNPRFSLWLMGYPAEWASCAEQAMQSCRKSRRSSSKHHNKDKK